MCLAGCPVGLNHNNIKVLESRFSDSESSVLDALDMGMNYEYKD